MTTSKTMAFDANAKLVVPANGFTSADWDKDHPFPDPSQFSKWCDYDKKRYYAYKKSLSEAKAEKTKIEPEQFDKLQKALEKLNVFNGDVEKLFGEIKEKALYKPQPQEKQSAFLKLFGLDDVEKGSKVSTNIAMFRGPNGERMKLGETLGKFSVRMNDDIHQKFRIGEVKKMIEEVNGLGERKLELQDNFIMVVK